MIPITLIFGFKYIPKSHQLAIIVNQRSDFLHNQFFSISQVFQCLILVGIKLETESSFSFVKTHYFFLFQTLKTFRNFILIWLF
jgi:hypothetical protein